MGANSQLTCWEFIFKDDTDELNMSIGDFFLLLTKNDAETYVDDLEDSYISVDTVCVSFVYVY